MVFSSLSQSRRVVIVVIIIITIVLVIIDIIVKIIVRHHCHILAYIVVLAYVSFIILIARSSVRQGR